MRTARKALRGAAERHGEGVPRWRGRSYLSVSVKTEKHTLALNVVLSESRMCSSDNTLANGGVRCNSIAQPEVHSSGEPSTWPEKNYLQYVYGGPAVHWSARLTRVQPGRTSGMADTRI
ncbi:unnamed protein product [Pleuronectes platessa]|uniref:Uncharacterized protein n=1 Tax=Pleuronectes platessa TaxID=8262 RepID=A0A9N7YX40_PLEPL|nr:unnamed protein product [Pleuronectes platessa]